MEQRNVITVEVNLEQRRLQQREVNLEQHRFTLKLTSDKVNTRSKICRGQYYTFYHGYCKDQRNAAVIILRYTTLRHNGL